MVSPCMQLIYTWSVFKASSAKEAWDAALTGTAASSKDLLLPGPLPGSDGDIVTLQVAASFKGSTLAATTRVTLNIRASPLQAVITGKADGVKSSGVVILDAASSFDPDDIDNRQPMAVSWSCVHEDFPKACFGSANSTNRPTVSGITYNISGSAMDAGKWHKIVLKISKGKPARIS